jgi:phosphoribosylanthranilate isomerase
MIIQIYEIQSVEEAQSMVAAGVDHIGSVILSKERWKDANLKTVVDLVVAAGRKSSLIPLFDDETVIARCLDYYRPQILHFCDTVMIGAASEIKRTTARSYKRQQFVRDRFPQIDIMRSIPVANDGYGQRLPSIEMAKYFEPVSDWLLIDTFLISGSKESQNQPVQGFVGITGQICDWQVARQMVAAVKIPVILAGGIGPNNAYAAVLSVQPAGIDSCTNTNMVDGQGQPIRFRKDIDKVRAMVQAARDAQKALGKT